jgi:hypothetical protein
MIFVHIHTAFFQKCFSSYNHLTRLLTKILDERPNDVVDVFEDLSVQVKQEQFKANQDTIVDKPDKSAETVLAEIQLKLFSVGFYSFSKQHRFYRANSLLIMLVYYTSGEFAFAAITSKRGGANHCII